MQNFEIRVFLKFFWKNGLSTRAAVREICSVEGEGSVSNPTASAWFKKCERINKNECGLWG